MPITHWGPAGASGACFGWLVMLDKRSRHGGRVTCRYIGHRNSRCVAESSSLSAEWPSRLIPVDASRHSPWSAVVQHGPVWSSVVRLDFQPAWYLQSGRSNLNQDYLGANEGDLRLSNAPRQRFSVGPNWERFSVGLGSIFGRTGSQHRRTVLDRAL